MGHSIKTMEKYFENIIFCQLKAEIVDGKREEIEDGDFKTFDIDFL